MLKSHKYFKRKNRSLCLAACERSANVQPFGFLPARACLVFNCMNHYTRKKQKDASLINSGGIFGVCDRYNGGN